MGILPAAAPLQRRGVAGLRHNRIRLREPSQRGVVESCIVKVQPDGSIFPLACKAKAGGGWAYCRCGPGSAPAGCRAGASDRCWVAGIRLREPAQQRRRSILHCKSTARW